MNSDFTVTFWGVRGSFPAPGPQTARVGGNTPCVQVRVAEHDIIFDAGTGIIGLGRALAARSQKSKEPLALSLFFTHTHHDHTQGLPFFIPARFPLTALCIFGPQTLEPDLKEVLSRSMRPPVFPITLDDLPCQLQVTTLAEGEIVVMDDQTHAPIVHQIARERIHDDPNRVTVRLLHSHAHPSRIILYRVDYQNRSFVYATDTEGYEHGDQRLKKFAENATLLAHDAQFTDEEYAHPLAPRQGWGHSTWRMAVAMAQATHSQKLALFHHDPEHSDDALEAIERDAQKIFPNTFLAREGMTVEL